MGRKLLKKILCVGLLSVSLLGISSVGASAEWRQLNNNWYYYDNAGILAKNTTIDGQYYVGSDGVWIPNYNIQSAKIYSAGEKWIVDGQWEFTINSVTTTKKRNQFSDKNPAQVLLIDYSYKNLGYVDNIQDLYFGTFTIMDEKGEVADNYPATISNYPKPTPVGGTCSNAISAYGVKNESSYITIKVEKYKSGYAGKETATFKVPIE